MEFAKTEVIAIEHATQQADQDAVQDLNDAQLLLIGGGIGDVVFV